LSAVLQAQGSDDNGVSTTRNSTGLTAVTFGVIRRRSERNHNTTGASVVERTHELGRATPRLFQGEFSDQWDTFVTIDLAGRGRSNQ
jgi:hypothetical protein